MGIQKQYVTDKMYKQYFRVTKSLEDFLHGDSMSIGNDYDDPFPETSFRLIFETLLGSHSTLVSL